MARRWDRSLRECSLETVMAALYGHEINCGVSSFWDGGFTVWIGDEMNGRKAEVTVRALDCIPEWLVVNAEALYPALLSVAA